MSSYSVILFEADVTPQERRAAQARFCKVLEEVLGDAALVAPVYAAYLRIIVAYGEAPPPDTLTDAEQAIFEQWRAAETAAVAAAFGPNRYMGDAMYEIRIED